MVVCACCGRYWVQEVTFDHLDGTVRTTFLVRRGGLIVGEYRTRAEAKTELDRRGILMWPEPGCE